MKYESMQPLDLKLGDVVDISGSQKVCFYVKSNDFI